MARPPEVIDTALFSKNAGSGPFKNVVYHFEYRRVVIPEALDCPDIIAVESGLPVFSQDKNGAETITLKNRLTGPIFQGRIRL
jgi:hypothetical protein